MLRNCLLISAAQAWSGPAPYTYKILNPLGGKSGASKVLVFVPADGTQYDQYLEQLTAVQQSVSFPLWVGIGTDIYVV